MDKKKVKEKLEKIQRTLDSLRGYNDRINKLVLILDDCIKDDLKELYKSDWISVEDEPAPRLEWDGSWNDINKSTPIANGEAFKYPIIIYAKLQGVLKVGIVITPEELANIAKLATTKFDKVLLAYVRDIVPGVKPKGL